jgi:hypothetical protein
MSISGDRVVREGTPVRRVTMYPSRVRCSLLVLVSGLFTAGGAYMLVSAGAVVMSIAVTAFFALCTAFALWRLLSGRPVLMLDERGISNATSMTGTEFLPWAEIASVYEHRGGVGRSWIGVDLRDGAASARREGAVTRLNRTLFGGSMHIMTVTLPLPIEGVLDEVGTIAPDDVYVMGRIRFDWT